MLSLLDSKPIMVEFYCTFHFQLQLEYVRKLRSYLINRKRVTDTFNRLSVVKNKHVYLRNVFQITSLSPFISVVILPRRRRTTVW
jgi:hypothetical protein